jgi:diguanylate cyclase (GGDEF)-like protein
MNDERRAVMEDYRKTVMVVDSRPEERDAVKMMLSEDYKVLEATGAGDAMLQISCKSMVDAILLGNLRQDGREVGFLDKIRNSGYGSIPVLVILEDSEEDPGLEALDHGAWDYVTRPVRPKTLRNRLDRAVHHCKISSYNPLVYMSERDRLTGLYNREKMFAETRRMIDRHMDTLFVFLRFDIDRFRLYNAVFGEHRGDKLLTLMAESIEGIAGCFDICTYGRINADTFCICEPYDSERLHMQVRMVKEELAGFEKNYLLEPTVGAYIVEEPDLAVEEMYIRAFIGSKKCKNKFASYLGFYDMDEGIREVEEAAIASSMQAAMDEEQFVVYFQPKFDIANDRDIGAEALVRWKHPDTGLMPPKHFIPIFEKNGFISRLDYYVWEHVCRLIHKWLGDGICLDPITVNISRISLYNPRLADILSDLIEQYDVPIGLLNLEITESAYVSDPELIQEAIRKLHQAGFILLMDDFGSGYSSLNMLKDIDVDVLKIDMQFLSGGESPGKGKIILESVIQMANNLGMPVIMEGVETQEQTRFLYKIGCNYVQGYYYARPMPQEEYEKKYIYRRKGATL